MYTITYCNLPSVLVLDLVVAYLYIFSVSQFNIPNPSRSHEDASANKILLHGKMARWQDSIVQYVIFESS